MNDVYVAFYKHKRKITSLKTLLFYIFDTLTRVLTRGKYSHCEIAIKRDDGLYDCYSASVRDGGVRMKTMALNDGKWDLVSIECDKQQIIDYYRKTQNHGYDFFGAVGIVLPIREDREKAFCSEWVYNCLFDSEQGWRFDPNDLRVILG